MTTNIPDILKRLNIKDTGTYENHFYVINIDSSDDYAKMYTKLDKNAINVGYPGIEKNTNNSTTKIINYFELDEDNITYDLFLVADFDKDKYYLKITDRDDNSDVEL